MSCDDMVPGLTWGYGSSAKRTKETFDSALEYYELAGIH